MLRVFAACATQLDFVTDMEDIAMKKFFLITLAAMLLMTSLTVCRGEEYEEYPCCDFEVDAYGYTFSTPPV